LKRGKNRRKLLSKKHLTQTRGKGGKRAQHEKKSSYFKDGPITASGQNRARGLSWGQYHSALETCRTKGGKNNSGKRSYKVSYLKCKGRVGLTQERIYWEKMPERLQDVNALLRKRLSLCEGECARGEKRKNAPGQSTLALFLVGGLL